MFPQLSDTLEIESIPYDRRRILPSTYHLYVSIDSLQGTLNIFLASDEHINLDHATLELRDLMGRLIRSLPLPHSNTTYIIDAQSLTAGNYFLTLTKDGQVLQSEEIVRE